MLIEGFLVYGFKMDCLDAGQGEWGGMRLNSLRI
jgi:hypothetical protein